MAIEHRPAWVLGIGSVVAIAIGAAVSRRASVRPDAWSVLRRGRDGMDDVLKITRTAGEAKQFSRQMPGSRVEPYIIQSAADDMHFPPSSR